MKKRVRSILRRGQDGFTLIELLAVMAILAILVAVVAPSVTGTRDASIRAQAQQDAKQVTTAAADFYGDQNEAETRTPHSTVVEAIAVNTLPTSKATGQQMISNRWPEKLITVSAAGLTAGLTAGRYAVEFEPVADAQKVVLVTLREENNQTAVDKFNFLSYTAIDLAGLDAAGYLSQIPDGADLTTTVEGVAIHNFLWLFKKETSGEGVADDIRTVTVFQLVATDINEGQNTVNLTYKRIL